MLGLLIVPPTREMPGGNVAVECELLLLLFAIPLLLCCYVATVATHSLIAAVGI